MKKLNKKILASVLALGCISPVMAETVTGNLTVTAEVAASCVLTVNNFVFAEGKVVETNTDLTAMFGVLCSKGTGYALKVNAGNGDGATTTNRSMKSASGDSLKYSLAVPSKSIVNLGDTAGSILSDTGTGVLVNHPVVATIPGSQYVTPGAYADTLTVTLEY